MNQQKAFNDWWGREYPHATQAEKDTAWRAFLQGVNWGIDTAKQILTGEPA